MATRTPRTVESDHDLLIRIDQKVESLGTSIAQMQTAFEGRLQRLEAVKAASADLDTLRSFVEKTQEKTRTDVDWTKRMIWMALGGVIVFQAVVAIALAFYFHK